MALVVAWLLSVHYRYQIVPVGGGYPVVYRLDRWTGTTVLVAGNSAKTIGAAPKAAKTSE